MSHEKDHKLQPNCFCFLPFFFFSFVIYFHLFHAVRPEATNSSTLASLKAAVFVFLFFFHLCWIFTQTEPAFKNSIQVHSIRQPYCTCSVSVWCEPVISPSGPHIVIPKRGRLELHCHDNATTSGAPSKLRWQRERARRPEGEVEEGGVAYVRVPAVQVYHMGRYVCVNNSTLEHSSIYVYVKGGCLSSGGEGVCVCLRTSTNPNLPLSSISSDPQNAFQRTMVNVILVRAGENCTIPCLVTDPEVSRLALETCDGRPLPSGMSFRSHLQRGVIISNVRKEYEGCYVCVGQLGGVKVTSSQYTVDVRLGKRET